MREGQAPVSQHEIGRAPCRMLQEMGFILSVFILNRLLVWLKALGLSEPQKFWINALSFFFNQLSCKKEKVKGGHSEEGY